MKFLEKTDIIFINQRTINTHGGNFMPPSNLLKEQPLDYVIEVVQSEMFGMPLYPEIYDKARVYLFNIIANHIFTDGNKRTGLEAALAFLKLNKYQIRHNLTNNVVLDFVIKVASGESNLDECREWFKNNIVPI